MQSRVKQLRMIFGLDQASMAELLGCTVEQVRAWESGEKPLTDEDLDLFDRRFGVARAWLVGEDVPVWGRRFLELRQTLGREMRELSGPLLIQLISATTGERIAYVVNRMRRAAPGLCTVECMACWLGLAPESTELLLQRRLDPGTPVIARASDLTGLSERWFRVGPDSSDSK